MVIVKTHNSNWHTIGITCMYLLVIYRTQATIMWSCLHNYTYLIFLSIVLHFFFQSFPLSVNSRLSCFCWESCSFFILQRSFFFFTSYQPFLLFLILMCENVCILLLCGFCVVTSIGELRSVCVMS